MYHRLSVLLSVISFLFINCYGQKISDFPAFSKSKVAITDSVLCATFKDLKEGIYILAPTDDTTKILKSYKESKLKFEEQRVFVQYVLFERNEDPSKDHKLVAFNDSSRLETLEIILIANDPFLVKRSLKKNSLYITSLEQAENLSSVYRIHINQAMCPPTGIFGKVGMCLDFAKEVFHPKFTDQEKMEILFRNNLLLTDRISKLENELNELKKILLKTTEKNNGNNENNKKAPK
jgi:hypothetical protein